LGQQFSRNIPAAIPKAIRNVPHHSIGLGGVSVRIWGGKKWEKNPQRGGGTESAQEATKEKKRMFTRIIEARRGQKSEIKTTW